jgi:hypothetical protein
LKRRRPRLKNVVAAFVAAPLGGAGAVAVVALLAMLLNAPADVAGAAAVGMFVLTLILGYVVAAVLGIPGYLLFRRFGWVRRAHWILLCAVLGSVAGAAWPLAAMLSGANAVPLTSIGGLALIGLLVGTASGFVFAKVIKIEAPRADEIAATFD